MATIKKIAITTGDPSGIGPEIVFKAIMSHEIAGLCEPIIIGDIAVVEEVAEKLNIQVDLNSLKIINTNEIKDRNFQRCQSTAQGGKACAAYIKRAVELALDKEVDAIVTAPISKESLKMAGLKWHGHTEMLAELTDTKDYAMMFYSNKLKLILVTIHTAIKNVPALITKNRVLKTINLAKKACYMMAIENPRIAVAGLNPHAGETGIFGDEEIREIIPAVNEAQNMGISVSGPYPADTLFHRAYNGEFDIIVCMYHDQGLIPLKMIAFDKAVNVTIGLPIIRTSPDHGTAYDIAWKGIANPSSMIEAIKLALKLRR
ncbi:4-hydroxythreonine-4-phosphate dehydrogenase [Dissulfurispira thermophila]|uniref:4-hydroxythreonine-4-phosphate dehydrogenase n=2 Tax=root TaxID=1 RepID=A0A7G1H4X8_9BACT|nr:4-hydroxythreonine-4-phosphate dehydrogenase PdxA [Dissulfurispira thermophila]BCB96767.1 4-hydroxythreonine-4-phosphate dehydrogenase [Dissulfurispira thermophila]